MRTKRRSRAVLTGMFVAALLVLGTPPLGTASEPTYTDRDLTTLTPIDPSGLNQDLGAVNDAILSGIKEWSREIGVDSMTEDEITKSIDTIDEALLDLPDDGRWWLHYKQLSGRQIELCLHLPEDNLYVDYCRVSDA
jgi:hypothetical protein